MVTLDAGGWIGTVDDQDVRPHLFVIPMFGAGIYW
jgi:hypothetical protein